MNSKYPIRIDLDELRKISVRGVLRAASFLGVGLLPTKTDPPQSVALSEESMWRFLPDPLPRVLATEIIEEYKAWLIGNALQEIDKHFTQFLDGSWKVLELSKIHGQSVSGKLPITDISNDTNASKKLKRIFEVHTENILDFERLGSLSDARNCLAHNFGIVRSRDAKTSGLLVLRWTTLEAQLRQGDDFVVISNGSPNIRAPDPSKDADLVFQLIEREKKFAIGDRIALAAVDLHEICHYYLRITDKVIAEIQRRLTDAGVPFEEKESLSDCFKSRLYLINLMC